MEAHPEAARLSRLERRLEREHRARLEAEAIAEGATRELYDAQQRLLEAQNRLVRQERLSALGTVASGVAHNFENLLTPILGYTELLLASPNVLADPPKATRYLESIRVAATDAHNLVGRLRGLYRPHESHEPFRAIEINPVIEQSLDLVKLRREDSETARGTTIHVERDLKPVPAVMGDESELRAVFTNLFINAFDAMPDGGTLRVRTQLDGPDVLVAVSDTGVGMSEATLKHCFELFYTTKGDRGTGLGLAMAYGSIQRHAGTIEVQSKLGVGTTFVIKLPAAGEDAKAVA